MAVEAEQVRSLGQPLLQNRWELVFPSIPGAGGETGTLSVRARACTIPGVSVDKTEVWFKGERVFYGTRVNSPGEIRVTLEEGYDLPVWTKFYDWSQLVGLGAPAVYKSVMVISVLDENNAVTQKVLIGGIFPQDVPEIPLEYANADNVNLDITFSTDWFQPL